MGHSPARQLAIATHDVNRRSGDRHRQAWQIDDESSTNGAAFDRDASAMCDGETSHDRQTDSTSGDGRVRIASETLKGFPDRRAVFHRDARALVLDRDTRVSAVSRHAHRHRLTDGTILHRVVEEVDHDLTNGASIHFRMDG